MFVCALSAAENPHEKDQLQKLTTGAGLSLKRKQPSPCPSPSPSPSHYEADDEEENSSDEEDDTPPETVVLPSVNVYPRYQSFLFAQGHALSTMVLAASKETESNPDRFRGQIYDLLNEKPYGANPNTVVIVVPDYPSKSYIVSLLTYTLLFCKNSAIIRLIAEKSSHEIKAEAFEYARALERIEADPDIRNPYFSYFFSEK